MGKVIYSQQVKLRFDVDGRPGRPFALQPLPDNGHVLTNCDVSWDTRPESVCNRQVYHADGAPADEKAPAKAGETILVYAYGLGKTTATVATGVLSPPDAVLTDFVGHPRVWAEFQKDFLNALSSTPRMLVYGPTGNDFLPVMFGTSSRTGRHVPTEYPSPATGLAVSLRRRCPFERRADRHNPAGDRGNCSVYSTLDPLRQLVPIHLGQQPANRVG